MSICSVSASRASASAAVTIKKVLYVEDHPVNVMLMRALVEGHTRVQLTVASTGEAGLQAALEQTPDLLLLDLGLPDCHGIELLQRMRACPQLAQVPAVAVTAEDLRTLKLDGTSFLEAWGKPLDLVHTLQRMDWLLGFTSLEPQRGSGVITPARSNGGPVGNFVNGAPNTFAATA